MFQSTHSLRSATSRAPNASRRNSVSIHALLAECDHQRFAGAVRVHSFNPRTPCGVRPVCAFTPSSKSGFNPRTPCGVRPSAMMGSGGSKPFQSTHSLRSATEAVKANNTVLAVSIHALLAECDSGSERPAGYLQTFQSTHSLRSATRARYHVDSDYRVSIHALLAECDVNPPRGRSLFGRFNPRTPCGVRPSPRLRLIIFSWFQSTHSLRSATGFRL